MAKKRKPENETEEEKRLRLQFEAISNNANRSEKTSWNRKMDNMVNLMASLRPIEQKILDIWEKEKNPIMDNIHELRKTMINECIHPYEYLVEKDGVIICKFCERRIGLVDSGEPQN